MPDWKFWADKLFEFRLFLQRSFWKPLHNTTELFHVLPLVATVILFVLLATDGQFREIYISYLEVPSTGLTTRIVSILAGLTAIALISVVLFKVHNALSTMRLHVVYSSHSQPERTSRLLRLQRAAAFTLAFMPWLGLTIGLFSARNFVVARYCQLLNVAHVKAETLEKMQFLPNVSGREIAGAVLFLGVVLAFFASVDERKRAAQFALGIVTPALATLLFMLSTDRIDANAWLSWSVWMYIALALATTLYLLIYHWLYHHRRGILMARLFTRTGISFRKRRRRRLALWAFLPWLALASYFAFAQSFNFAPSPSITCSGKFAWALSAVLGRWAIFPVAICCTIAVGLLIGGYLLRFGTDKRHQAVMGVVFCGLVLAVALLSLDNDPSLLVSVYRFIGPLATSSLELLFLVATFAVLAVLSQYSGFPALTLVLLTIIVSLAFPKYASIAALALALAYFSFAVVAFVSGRVWICLVMLVLIFVGWINFNNLSEGSVVPPNHPPDGPRAETANSSGAPEVRTAYLCWLDQRGIPLKRTDEQAKACLPRPEHLATVNGRYPVFIMAAEGGGIYAASAVATLLAKLEDREPGFSRHVFAISGVSGGAIGATVFQALDRARYSRTRSSIRDGVIAKGNVQPVDEEKCAMQAGSKGGEDLTTAVANIMQDDHFSPVVGSIFPEIFGARLTRSDALSASFEYSASEQDQTAGQDLCARFADDWSPGSSAPALVLNSTWVETGFRVAFAPFRLHDLDESLYSFFDTFMPDENCPHQGDPHSCVSLMTAAGVSARFPGIMPPFSVQLDTGNRWNFVDGGYSDNSGATTALDLYRALRNVSPDVDLRIALITSSSPQPRLESINGTVFRDTVAPIAAILKVREDLGDDAVARACSEIYGDKVRAGAHEMEVNEGCIDHAGKNGALQIVEMQDQLYGLPLGWKISQTSFAVISWMIGDASACPGLEDKVTDARHLSATPNDNTPNALLTNAILRRNSCVSRLLIDLVKNGDTQ